jgi:hypothetical protein
MWVDVRIPINGRTSGMEECTPSRRQDTGWELLGDADAIPARSAGCHE